jgi:hypothetical protein
MPIAKLSIFPLLNFSPAGQNGDVPAGDRAYFKAEGLFSDLARCTNVRLSQRVQFFAGL